MNHYGVILKQLRLIQKLQFKAAAAKIGRSAGWLSEIENNKGAARIHPQEFERIVAAYGGEAYRKHFSLWVANAHRGTATIKDKSLGGAILKYLRKKSGVRLESVASATGLSVSHLSRIETGVRPLSPELRDKLMRIYGYSPGSFKNFTTEDKRAKSVPARYKLNVLLKQMSDAGIERMLGFALSVSNTPSSASQEAV